MKKWVQTALEAAEQAKASRLKAAKIAHSLAEVTHALEVTQARVERALIKRAGWEQILDIARWALQAGASTEA